MRRGLFQSPIPERGEPITETPQEAQQAEEETVPQLVIEEDNKMVSFVLEEDEDASSAVSSNRTARLAALFPNKRTSTKFKQGSTILRLLDEECQMEKEFLARLEVFGYTSPATLVNRFGASNLSIANSFALMAPSYILDGVFKRTCIQL